MSHSNRMRWVTVVWSVTGAACLISASLPGSTLAQTETKAAPFLVRSWRTQDGLPQNSVQAMAQTPDGYLWIGTKGGLSQFDGVRFISYGLADGLKSLNVKTLAADGEGGLWIGTLGGGLSHWRDGVITSLTTADGLSHNDVYSLAAAEPGCVWVGTARGVQHWGPAGFTRIGESEGLDGLIPALAASPREGLWVSAESIGLFRFYEGRCERVALPPPCADRHPPSLLVDAEGDVWAGMGDGIVLRRHNGVWIEFNESHGLPFSYIYCLAQGVGGEIWAGSHEQGVFVFRDGRFHAVTGMEASIRAVTLSSDGVVWVGTQSGGLSRLTPPRVTAYPLGAATETGEINGVAEDPPGQFWVATWGGGLQRGPLEALEWVTGVPELREYPFLRSCLRSQSGDLYVIGSQQVGRRDAGADALSFTPPTTTILNCACEDADGSLLLGGRDGILKRLVGGVMEPVLNGNFSAPIISLLRGQRSGVWVATQGAGLFHWDAGKVEHWTTAEGLPTNLLRALHEDAEGTLWIGTGGGGLAWLKEGRVHSLDSRQGLANDAVSPILEDDESQSVARLHSWHLAGRKTRTLRRGRGSRDGGASVGAG